MSTIKIDREGVSLFSKAQAVKVGALADMDNVTEVAVINWGDIEDDRGINGNIYVQRFFKDGTAEEYSVSPSGNMSTPRRFSIKKVATL